MKKLFTLLTLVLCVCTGAWGESYNNQASTVTWAFTSHSSLGSTNSPADAYLSTNFSAGSNLNLSSVTRNGKDNAWGQNYNMVAFIPTATVAKNTGETAANTLTFTITPAKGITFTPTNVSLTGCNYGGTGDPKTNIYIEYSDESKETLASGISLIRDDKKADESGGGSSPSQLSYNLANAVAGKVIVKIWMDGLTNTAKGVAFTNIVVTGTVTGTPVATTTYTITAATNDVTLGSASGTATVAENEQVTLEANPTAAGKFVKWQKGGEDFAGNTANPLTVTATETITYTAIFEALRKITFNANGGTGTTPTTVYVEDNANYTIPVSYFLYKEGYTLTGWNDGTNTHAVGATINNITEDISLSAEYTENTVSLGNVATTVNWTFDKTQGPVLACENSEIDYVQHTTVNQTPLDVVMHVNTKTGAGVSGKTGKLNNTSNANAAQVNQGTVFTVPVIPGAVIKYTTTNGTVTASDVSFGGNTTGTVSGSVISYTYNGNAGTLDVIDLTGNFYPSGISVEYPIYVPGPAAAGNASVVLTYTNGSVSGKVWTGTKDTECEGYTITANSNDIGVKSSTKFALAIDNTYTISVPSGVKITSFKITGQANSSTSNVTYNGTTNGFGNSSETDYTWNVASPSAGGTIAFSVADKQLNVTSITLYTDDITLTTTANMAGWRAFYDASTGYTVDNNTKIYIVTAKDETKATLTEVTGRIPAQTPVLLKTSADNRTMTLTKATSGTDIDATENKLTVTDGTAVSNAYRLGYGAKGVGFYPYSATSPASGIVYLSSASQTPAKALTLAFSDVTGISGVSAKKAVSTGKRYNLSGQLVGEDYKGIVIENGKKYIK